MFSRLQPRFKFIEGFETIHKVWRSLEDVPYCFLKIIYQITWDKKMPILGRIERFRTPIWIHPWLWNDAKILM